MEIFSFIIPVSGQVHLLLGRTTIIIIMVIINYNSNSVITVLNETVNNKD